MATMGTASRLACVVAIATGAAAPMGAQDRGPCIEEKNGSVIESRDLGSTCEFFTGITMTDNPESKGRVYTVGFRSSRGGALGEYGFTFGEGEPDSTGVRSGFSLAIDRQGQYALIHFRGTRRTMLVDWSRSDAIRTGEGAENDMQVVTSEGVIRCVINGRYVGGYASDVRAGRLSYYVRGAGRLEVTKLSVADNPQFSGRVPLPGRVAIADDLVTSRRLQVGGGVVCRTSYGDQGYVVENVAARGLCDLPLVSVGTFGSQVRIEVELQLRAGVLDHSFGVLLGRPSDARDPTYVGAIDGQGTFQFARRQGAWQRLTRLFIHDAVRKGAGAWNRLAIEVRGRTLRGYVNGVEVGRADAAADVAGIIGFYVDEPGMVVVFRNLRVVEL
jgi:hypothetical protein